jgi:tetratricopeptide (TPR) repeat protein
MSEMEVWISKVYKALLFKLEEDYEVNGATFLNEYYSINWPDDLDYSVDDECFESYVSEKLDQFESWLTNKQQKVKVEASYHWVLASSSSVEPKKEGELNTPSAIESFLERTFEELELADFAELCKERDQLKKSGRLIESEKLAIMCINLAEKYAEIDSDNKVMVWEEYGAIAEKLSREESFSYFEKAGNIAASTGNTLLAATNYELAHNAYKNHNNKNWKEHLKLLRKARVMFSDAGVNEKASGLYIEESKLKLTHTDGFYNRLKGNSYRCLSNFGESPWLVLGWIFAIIVLWALLYWLVDINSPGTGIFKCDNPKGHETVLQCYEVSGKDSHPLSNLYFSFVTFTTLGFGDFSPTVGVARALAAIQALLGLFLSSLFIATFLRKFTR